MTPENILSACQGLHVCRYLTLEEKQKILAMEQPENRGVAEALARKCTLVATHDSTFRKPPTPTVILESEGRTVGAENPSTGEFEFEEGAGAIESKDGATGTYIFPPVPFPELEGIAQNVVSSSPSKQVHEYLMGLLELDSDTELATLLIGFDPKPSAQ